MSRGNFLDKIERREAKWGPLPHLGHTPADIINMLINGEFTQYLDLIPAIITAIYVPDGGKGSSANTLSPFPETPNPATQPRCQQCTVQAAGQQRAPSRHPSQGPATLPQKAHPEPSGDARPPFRHFLKYSLSSRSGTLQIPLDISSINGKATHEEGILTFCWDG